MTPDLLKTFIAITETGNFTIAGERVGRTQGAVSQMVRRLEEELGCTLFNRKSTPISLTQKGKQLLPHARQILSAHSAALASFDQSDVDGQIALGMPEIYADILIPRLLPGFQERFPRVRINLELRDTIELIGLLQTGALDLTFATDGELPSLSGHIVHEAPVVWIAPIGRALEVLDPLPLVVWKHGTNYEKTVLQSLAKAGRAANTVVNTQTLSGMITSVRANLGVAAVTINQQVEGVRHLDRDCGLPQIPPRRVRLERAFAERSPAVDRLQDHILTTMSE